MSAPPAGEAGTPDATSGPSCTPPRMGRWDDLDTLGPMPSRVISWEQQRRLRLLEPPPARRPRDVDGEGVGR